MQQSQQTRKRFERGGFTLIELLIVIMLVIVLSAAAFTGLFRSQRSFTFNGADQQVGALVREARSLAVTGKSVIDYTDYDQDGCRHANNHTGCTTLPAAEDDRVTPANYGVHFDTGTGTMTLFADMHPESSMPQSTEGVYDVSTGGFGVYTAGEDIKIAEYTVPATLDLLASGYEAGVGVGMAADTVMFSPLFADTSFYDSVAPAARDLTGEFFVFGLRETGYSNNRDHCLAIHPLAGVAETTDATGTDCP